jgi:hypothetical protein
MQVRDTDITHTVLLKPTHMTIHWKAHEHFLMVPLVFRFNHFRGKYAFTEFF